jgi:hypothetical protein
MGKGGIHLLKLIRGLLRGHCVDPLEYMADPFQAGIDRRQCDDPSRVGNQPWRQFMESGFHV